MHYNWIRKHKTLGTTPAVAAGLTDKAMNMADVVAMIDDRAGRMIANKRWAIANRTPLAKVSY